MGVYVYCIREDYSYKSSIAGRQFENKWLRLEPDGMITVKGTHDRGYAWDGCSPKMKVGDIYFGTSEAVLNDVTRQPKTYYASLIHDVFYQFNKDVRSFIRRGEIDKEFYNILKRDGFIFARLYHWFVRAFGWYWWYFR